jgi:hypothetical protein
MKRKSEREKWLWSAVLTFTFLAAAKFNNNNVGNFSSDNFLLFFKNHQLLSTFEPSTLKVTSQPFVHPHSQINVHDTGGKQPVSLALLIAHGSAAAAFGRLDGRANRMRSAVAKLSLQLRQTHEAFGEGTTEMTLSPCSLLE